jgi:hypothetical protein
MVVADDELSPAPVDDARLAKLRVAAALVLQRGDRHSPLERQWAREVFDLASALMEARNPSEKRPG